MQYVGMGGGDPVSTVDFERLPVDLSMTARMVAESRRELTSATEKTLEQVWGQHKTLVVEHFFEEFERSKLFSDLCLVIFEWNEFTVSSQNSTASSVVPSSSMRQQSLFPRRFSNPARMS
jgi:hypothetical protein